MIISQHNAKVIEGELATLPHLQRVERCARLCYKSEERLKVGIKGIAQSFSFCKGMWEKGHRSPFEMSVIHIALKGMREEDFPIPFPPFSLVSWVDGVFYITASIRSYVENFHSHPVLDLLRFTALSSVCTPDQTWLYCEDGEYVKENRAIMHAMSIWARIIPPSAAPLHHLHIAVNFITNRSTSHQLVRHRPMSWLQESQRYCCYKGGLEVIEPTWRENGLYYQASKEWELHMLACEKYYTQQLANGLSPQQARGGLPNDTKTELIGYAPLLQWKHLLKERTGRGADPEMRELVSGLGGKLQKEVNEIVVVKRVKGIRNGNI